MAQPGFPTSAELPAKRLFLVCPPAARPVLHEIAVLPRRIVERQSSSLHVASTCAKPSASQSTSDTVAQCQLKIVDAGHMADSSPVAEEGTGMKCWICGEEEAATREHLFTRVRHQPAQVVDSYSGRPFGCHYNSLS